MSRTDPTVEVICDNCHESIEWEPSFVYRDFSGKSGFHDVSEKAFKAFCKAEGWTYIDEKTQYCDNCTPEEDEDDEQD